MERKGISTVVAAALIVVIALGLTSTAYIWGAPLIQKRQEASTTENVFNLFSQTNQNSLPEIIEDVASNRGVKTFGVNGNGVWKLNVAENSIEYLFSSKTSNVAADTVNPVSLTPGVQCTGTSPYLESPSPSTGTLGQDSSSVVCVKATTQGDTFAIRYKIWFREVDDNPFSPTQGYQIILEKDPTGLVTSTGSIVKITYDDTAQQTIGGKTLITKKIKILLI
ncbi:MAG: hypothetical protein HYW23_00790 [Candidatus Aenigmarchaeota archaeon]|nr:hypothetical protein [Candidatus Aenigmarchaeota archaeon]